MYKLTLQVFVWVHLWGTERVQAHSHPSPKPSGLWSLVSVAKSVWQSLPEDWNLTAHGMKDQEGFKGRAGRGWGRSICVWSLNSYSFFWNWYPLFVINSFQNIFCSFYGKPLWAAWNKRGEITSQTAFLKNIQLLFSPRGCWLWLLLAFVEWTRK